MLWQGVKKECFIASDKKFYMESINKKVVVLFIDHYIIWCSFGERYQFLWCSSEPDEVLMMHFVGLALRRSRVRRKFFVFRQIYQL